METMQLAQLLHGPTLNEQAAAVHVSQVKWWKDIRTGEPINRDRKEVLQLVLSEIGEGTNGLRKNLMDDHLPHRTMIAAELADTKIRLLDMAAGYGMNLPEHVQADKLSASPRAGLFDISRAVVACLESNGYYVAVAIRTVERYADMWGHDLEAAIAEKMAYNLTRKDHTNEARQGEHGKVF